MNRNKQSQPNEQSGEEPINIEEAMNVDYGYCLYHSYTDVLFVDDEGNEFHNHYTGIWGDEGDFNPCCGPFVHCEPPPSLTDEEWEIIFQSEEGDPIW